MNKRLAKQKFLFLIITISLINIFTLFIWFFLKISPIIPKINNLKKEINNEVINIDYTSLDNFNEDINYISRKYNVYFIIEDKYHNKIINNDKKSDMSLYTFMIDIDNNTYLVKTYLNKDITLTRLFLGLFIFQAVIITLIFGILIMFSKKIIFTPIDELISLIKNYKVGKKLKGKKVNTEFDLIHNEFVNLTLQLEKEKNEQNRIIASISHDIKTPLTSIIGYSNLLNDENIDKEDIKKYNNKINSKALHIKDLLNQFDEYLLNQENITLKLENILIKDLIKELNDDYKIELENNNIKFNIKSNVSNEYVKIDKIKIKRVFSNIISNSARYLNNGGIININIVKDKKYIKFIISDNGPGVNEDVLNKIFDPLFTTDKSRKISGLGLSICKEFINMHGGFIEAYNDNGLTIVFKLPR